MVSSHEAIARDLLEQHKQRQSYHPLDEDTRGGSLSEAYRIQKVLQDLFIADGAGAIVGYKVALTSAAMQAMVNVDQPLAGGIFETRVHQSPVTLELNSFQHLGIECEIAVRLAVDLPGRTGGHDAESVAPAIGAIMPAFELIEDRNADYGAIDAFSLVADNAWNGGIILGPETADWQATDLLAIPGDLKVNGETLAQGKGADALGHPLAAVAWLADLLAAQGGMLERDMIVMTGSIVKTYFPAPGDALTFSLGDLGIASLTLGSA